MEEPSKAIVAAKFNAADVQDPIIVRFIFILENNMWRIDDMTGSSNDDSWILSDILKG
jgi:hypothetical protein